MLNVVRFEQRCCASTEEITDNVTATLSRGYEGLTDYLNGPNEVCSIVGSGPSVTDTYQDLRGHVLAINSAHGFLIDRKITPHMAMFWDASPLVAEFAVPNPDTVYLVASRCHPYVFDRLSGCRVIVWFASGDPGIKELLQKRLINEPMILGVSAGVTRAMFLMYALGYRTLHVYGADSSYSGDKTHVQGSLAKEGDLKVWLDPEGRGKAWRTTPEMMIQTREHRKIVPMFKRLGASIEVHGSGMLPEVHRSIA